MQAIDVYGLNYGGFDTVENVANSFYIIFLFYSSKDAN